MSLCSPEFGGRGAGRKRTVDKDPTLREDLDRLVDPATRGDPESPLRWTCKSVRMLAEELRRVRVMRSVIKPSPNCFTRWITACRPTRRSWRGASNRIGISSLNTSTGKAQRYLKQGEPVILGRLRKKKELVGHFKESGARMAGRRAQPEEVRVHDFQEIRQPENGKVAPYGVYDLGRNAGWVSVPGVDHDTAEFAVVEHTPLVALDGPPQLSESAASVDYGRLRRR